MLREGDLTWTHEAELANAAVNDYEYYSSATLGVSLVIFNEQDTYGGRLYYLLFKIISLIYLFLFTPFTRDHLAFSSALTPFFFSS